MADEVRDLKLKIIETRAKIAAGREKNLKAAKNLRRELARKLSEMSRKENKK